MELTEVSLLPSPRRPGWVRLAGTVRLADGATEEVIWLDVAEADASALVPSADPFVPWLAAVASRRRATLRLAVPADRTLIENVREVTRAWRTWYPEFGEVAIAADCAPLATAGAGAPPTAPRGVASMFTGGVDSFFTALRHDAGEGTPRTLPIDTLVFVHGFDVPLANTAAATRVIDALRQAADAMGKRLLVVATNLRESCFAATDWARHSHGAALAGVAHAIGGGYHTVLIASSAGYGDLRFWGSHPLIDPMFTSSRLQVLHDGAAFMRVEKTAYVARSPLARRHLRVCYRSASGDNCGRCNNCYRTMLAMETLGVLGECATFDRDALNLQEAGRVYCRHDFDRRQFGYLRDLARREGRTDIEAAVERALHGSARLTRRIAALRRLRDLPLAWRWAPAWERRLLRGWID